MLKRTPLRRKYNPRNASYNQEVSIGEAWSKVGIPSSRQPGSGKNKSHPADAVIGNLFLCEAKLTRTGNLTIKPEWIAKVKQQAKDAGKDSWILEAWVAEGNKNYTKVVILDADFFRGLFK